MSICIFLSGKRISGIDSYLSNNFATLRIDTYGFVKSNKQADWGTKLYLRGYNLLIDQSKLFEVKMNQLCLDDKHFTFMIKQFRCISKKLMDESEHLT